MNDRQYAHSDLAVECGGGYRGRGAEFKGKRNGCDIQILEIRDRGGRCLRKPEGRYVTVTCGKIWEMDDRGLRKSARCWPAS